MTTRTPAPSLRPRHAAAFVITASAALALTGCVSILGVFGTQSARSTALSPRALEQEGQRVFFSYGIPVAEFVPDHRVWSGWFDAAEVWEAAALDERVSCGWTAGGSRVRGEAVILEVLLVLGQQRGSAEVSLTSKGYTAASPGGEKGVPCRLTPRFSDELVAAVTGTGFDLATPVARGAFPGAEIGPDDAEPARPTDAVATGWPGSSGGRP